MRFWILFAVEALLLVALAWTLAKRRERRRALEEAQAAKPKKAPEAPAAKKAEPPVPKASGPAPKGAHGDGVAVAKLDLPRFDYEEDTEVDPTKVGASQVPPPPIPIVYDREAEQDEPTQASPIILTSASAQTDKGVRRKRNEDSMFVSDEQCVYIVADGMGGYSGGQLASSMAVKEIGEALQNGVEAPSEPTLPRPARELAQAIQVANLAIHEKASSDRRLDGMGTTVTAARFSPNKQRLFVGHVGDSRCYRFRDGKLSQMTADHTMRDLGVTGPEAAHLSRAVGIWPVVPVDMLIAKPLAGDVYLLCSDGLTKMISTERISQVLAEETEEKAAAERLVALANEAGGKDNVTVIIVRVHPATSGRKVA